MSYVLFTVDYFSPQGTEPAHTEQILAPDFARATEQAKRSMREYAAVRVSRTFLADHADTNMDTQHYAEEAEGIIL